MRFTRNITLSALLLQALVLLACGSAPLIAIADETRDLAGEFITQYIAPWQSIQNDSFLRLRVTGDPIVVSMAVWDRNGQLTFPPSTGVNHVNEDALLDNLKRLEALRSSGSIGQWEPVTRGGERYFWCSDDRCLLVDGPALMDALGLASRRHTELPPAVAQAPTASTIPAITGSVLVALLGLVMLRRVSQQKYAGDGTGAPAPHPVFDFAHTEVDGAKLVVRDEDGERDLSRREFALLELFASRPESVISKDELYDAGWGRDYQPTSRALDQQILTLRRKLDPKRQRESIIETVHGQGYRFNR